MSTALEVFWHDDVRYELKALADGRRVSVRAVDGQLMSLMGGGRNWPSDELVSALAGMTLVLSDAGHDCLDVIYEVRAAQAPLTDDQAIGQMLGEAWAESIRLREENEMLRARLAKFEKAGA
jgi:hypothetical protein